MNVLTWQFITYQEVAKGSLKGSGRLVTATTEENASIFEKLVCAQEDEPGTNNSVR